MMVVGANRMAGGMLSYGVEQQEVKVYKKGELWG